MKLSKVWSYFIAAPGAALSMMYIISKLEFQTGIGPGQALEFVHAILVGWNHLHGIAFNWIDLALPIEFHTTAFERNFVIIIFAMFFPYMLRMNSYFISESRQRFSQRQYLWGTFNSIFLITTSLGILGGLFAIIFMLITDLPTSANAPPGPLIALMTMLFVLGLVIKPARRYFSGILFAMLFVLSLEGLRYVPNLAPQLEIAKTWLEDLSDEEDPTR